MFSCQRRGRWIISTACVSCLPPPPDYRYIFHSHTPTYTHTRTQINIRHDSSQASDMINLLFNTLLNMLCTTHHDIPRLIFSSEFEKMFVLINSEVIQLRICSLLELNTKVTYWETATVCWFCTRI